MAQFKIIQDELKQQYTSHWDLDYMTTAQVEAAVQEGRRKSAAPIDRKCKRPDSNRRFWWNRPLFMRIDS